MSVQIAALFLPSAGHFLSGIILSDPIFDGGKISMLAGEVPALLIGRMAVPVLYFIAHS